MTKGNTFTPTTFNLQNFNESAKVLASNKFLAGIALLMLNIGSRYMTIEMSQSSQQLLKLKLVRRFTMFCIFFVGTRDIVISMIMTASFIIISGSLFNEQSKFCILPKAVKNGGNGTITDDEYFKAKDTIAQYEKQESAEAKIVEKEKEEMKKIQYYEMKTILAKTTE